MALIAFEDFCIECCEGNDVAFSYNSSPFCLIVLHQFVSEVKSVKAVFSSFLEVKLMSVVASSALLILTLLYRWHFDFCCLVFCPYRTHLGGDPKRSHTMRSCCHLNMRVWTMITLRTSCFLKRRGG